jgi:uncharacterized MAPEG superfamily protein
MLGLFHIFAASTLKTQLYGTAWNASARDEPVQPPTPLIARLDRAQANFFETFPLVVAAIALLGITGVQTRATEIGAVVWLVARIVYLPLYAAGIPYVRSAVFLVSLVGLLMMLWPMLF